MARPQRDLINGPIGSTLLMFAIPTLAGNVLQTLNVSINMVWIGRFLGESALSATSNASNILFLSFSAFFGFGMATTVLVGQHIGRKDVDGARRAFGAAIGLFLAITIVMVALGIAFTDKLLHLMGTPREAVPLASAYLKTMLLTLPPSALVILVMMTLRGAGDALTPLWFMIIGIVIDAGLNPLFIAGIGPFPEWGIVGSAVATLISNFVSLVGVLVVLYWRDLPIRLRGAEFRYLLPPWPLLRLIFVKGVAMGMQMLVLTMSGLVMVGLVNHAGVYASAAYGVAFQLWNYVQMPSMALGAAVSAMAAQNIGAGRWDRVGAITRIGIFYNVALTGTLIALLTWFDHAMLGLFLAADSPSMPIAQHIQLLAGWSFLFTGMTMTLFGTARANGAVVGPLIIFIIGLLVCRLGFALAAQPWLGFDALWWAYPFGSIVTCALAWAYYVVGRWKKGRADRPGRTRGAASGLTLDGRHHADRTRRDPRGKRRLGQHLAIDRHFQRGDGLDPDFLAAIFDGRVLAGAQLQIAGEPAPAELRGRAADHGLDDDLAALGVGLVDQLDAAMIGAVGDPYFQRVEFLAHAVMGDDQLERLELHGLVGRPDQIAEPSERLLEDWRYLAADLGRQADRGAIAVIIVVYHAQIDPAGRALGDHLDRPVEIERYLQRTGEAVRGAQRQDREHRVGADQLIDRAGQRSVAAADDQHRRLLRHRACDDLVERAGLVDRYAVDQLDARIVQFAARGLELLLALARQGIHDQYRGAGSGCVDHRRRNARGLFRVHIIPDNCEARDAFIRAGAQQRLCTLRRQPLKHRA